MLLHISLRSTSLLLAALVLCLLPLTFLRAAGLAPAAPANLNGSIDAGVASLAWEIPTDDDTVEGYNIYINDEYTTTVFTNSFSTSVEPDTLYSFRVVAFDEVPRQFSQASDALTLPASLVPDDLTIPPSVPTGLTGELSGNSVSLSWEPSTDDEAVLGYNVYRDNQYLTTVRTPDYIGDNPAGESHSWYVVAFDIRTNFSARSSSIVLPDNGPVDTTIPPSVPVGLSGEVQSGVNNDMVILNWQPSTDDQSVAGYNVYRNQQYITTIFSTEYVGTVPAGSSNAFSVVAFDFDGNFSTGSEPLTLPEGTAETDPGVPPSIPTGLAGDTTTSGGQTLVQLTWIPSNSSVAVSGYNIYRDNDYHTTVFSNAYTESVPAGSAYSYSVVAFDAFGNFSARSLPLSLLGDTNQPPFFSNLEDQFLAVDEPWELLLRPVDLDGGAAGILVSGLPSGVEFVDNLDGSRSLLWTPSVNETGSFDITITAFDLQDTDLRTDHTITLTVANETPPSANPFSISIAPAAYNLQEGNPSGLAIPVNLIRDNGFEAPITISVVPETSVDGANITTTVFPATVVADQTSSTINLQLGVDVLPILSQTRSFEVVATDGTNSATASVTVAVSPVALDDIYLIIGQSNAVGFSEEGAKQSGPGGFDEIDLRIRQANVQPNDSSLFSQEQNYADPVFNFLTPAFISAEDPLHEPVDVNTLAKESTRIGLGLSFAKSALPSTSRNIVLVPAAWAGSSFCDSASPAAHWNALPNSNPTLGNTLLFDRALARVNETLQATGGVLRGILWHQGESDSNDECASLYESNLVTMVSEFRSRIVVDARGELARGPVANVPFVLGTMSRGSDARGDLSLFNAAKQTVDLVHRNIASLVPHSEVVLTDDLIPANGYPCGQGSCIHFGAAALREIGSRSYDAMLRAASN